MQLGSQYSALPRAVWGSTLGEQQSAQSLSVSLHCLIALTHSTGASTSTAETFSTDLLSPPPPLCVLPRSLTNITNQGAQPCIITLCMLLLFPSPAGGKSVERLFKGCPSRAQAKA